MEYRAQGVAAVYEEASGPSGVRLRERPVTPPEPGAVLVRLRAAALNHLDLFTVRGLQRIEIPRVICADGAGVVERSEADGWNAGDEVVLYPVSCDWTCAECSRGQQVFCRHFGILGEHVDGTACQLLQVPARNVFRKPAQLSWEEAAAFPLTFLTAWRMLTTRARLQSGETVLVVGAGAGVAAAAITLAKHLGARVLATSRSPEKRDKAVALGAEAAFPSSEFAREVRSATGGRGADVVVEHVGPATFDESVKALAPGGRIVFCGSTTGAEVELNMPRVFFRQADILGSTMGNAGEFQAVLEAVAAGARPVIDAAYPLERISEALQHLEQGTQFGKVVLSIQ